MASRGSPSPSPAIDSRFDRDQIGVQRVVLAAGVLGITFETTFSAFVRCSRKYEDERQKLPPDEAGHR